MDSLVEESRQVCADPSLQLDVDVMTLDYLVFNAIKYVFEDVETQQANNLPPSDISESTERAINSVDNFLNIFENHHLVDHVPPNTQFRIDILSLATLFGSRMVPHPTSPSPNRLKSIRKCYKHRAQDWYKARSASNLDPELNFPTNQLSVPLDHLQFYRNNALFEFNVPHPPPNGHGKDAPFYGTESSVSLLDLLPSFMHISATCTNLYSNVGVSDVWMHLAGEFMLQATLDSVLCFGRKADEVAAQAFAWGFVKGRAASDWDKISVDEHEANLDAQLAFDESGLLETPEVNEPRRANNQEVTPTLWDSEHLVNNMFKADPETNDNGSEQGKISEVQGWAQIRAHYLKLLQPAENDSLINHFVQLAAHYPIRDFDTKVLTYIQALAQSIEAPILIQLERGRLEILNNSIEETNKFKQRVGLESWITQSGDEME